MSPSQKAARANLFIVAATLIVFLAAVLLGALCFHRPWAEAARPAMGVFGLMALGGLSGLYYRPRGRPRPLVDERDLLIERRSMLIGFTVFGVVWVVGSVGGWLVLLQLGVQSLPVDVLPWLVWPGLAVFIVVQSVAILVQYGRSSRNGG